MTSYQDRVEGVLLGTAAGDALGAPYEFQPPRQPDLRVAMVGGGPWAAGQWTDDTSMAIAIAEVAATGADLRDAYAQDLIMQRWREWSLTAKDVGIQTRSILAAASREGVITAAKARAESIKMHKHSGRTAGNGALMRTAPVALAYIDDESALVEAARAISELTHFDPDAGDACVLWSCAIRHAVRTSELDVRAGLRHLEPSRRALWAERLVEAEVKPPASFPNNGWVVTAMQAAWSAITTTPAGVFLADHLRLGLDAAVRAGYDTDTVAAIAGGLLGAAYGASAVPGEWRLLLHGWPGIRAHDLVALASAIERKGKPTSSTSPIRGHRSTRLRATRTTTAYCSVGSGLRKLPDEVDAVVSLCRLADKDMRTDIPHVEVRLIDRPEHDENPHLDFILLDAVKLVEKFRRHERTVLVHCVGAYSRTPTLAALYGARLRRVDVDDAVRDITAVLPGANPNRVFRAALRRIGFRSSDTQKGGQHVEQ